MRILTAYAHYPLELRAEANGAGPVITMRDQKWWAADLRKHLEAARIKRASLDTSYFTAATSHVSCG